MVGLGYARAAGVGPGLLAGLMTRAMHEAARIGIAAGGEEKTFYGVSGFGDLMAAMGADERPEVRFGRALVEGKAAQVEAASFGVRIEAIDLVPRVIEFARERGLQVPVFMALREVLAGRADKASVLPVLMRPPTRSRRK
jgi:glycerol-3-phosphate dehydrogenase (NAD(P)+)